ncbi:hypothetical protein BG000_000652 [Podila horticola]|nr:hypothetical protein BG000_000652 [Podila horticola]
MDVSEFNEETLELHTELQSITLENYGFLKLLKRCPNLCRVVWMRNFVDWTALLLNGLSVRQGKVEELSCDALTQHFATLQILSILEYIKNADTFIPTVLASCPLLTSITTPIVSAVNIISGRPWVCLRLKVFKITIEITDILEDAIRTQSREIFGRISKLVHLRALLIGAPYTEDPPTFQGLDLRLESGLSQLSTLQSVQELNFGGTIQDMSMEDIAWVTKHWTRLEHVVGRCNKHGTFEQYPGGRMV